MADTQLHTSVSYHCHSPVAEKSSSEILAFLPPRCLWKHPSLDLLRTASSLVGYGLLPSGLWLSHPDSLVDWEYELLSLPLSFLSLSLSVSCSTLEKLLSENSPEPALKLQREETVLRDYIP